MDFAIIPVPQTCEMNADALAYASRVAKRLVSTGVRVEGVRGMRAYCAQIDDNLFQAAVFFRSSTGELKQVNGTWATTPPKTTSAMVQECRKFL